MAAPSGAAEQRDWLALPAGVLQHIFGHTSTWQTPGSCLAALVCRTWRSAAAGCLDIPLLYFVGHAPADQSFATWLKRNSSQLGALTLSSITSECGQVIRALTEAAAAAQAAGRPLRLHTLRVLGARVPVDTVGQLLSALPHLRCLQLGTRTVRAASAEDTQRVFEALAPLQRATQLEQLYLNGPGPMLQDVAALLPPSLKRLSWDPVQYTLRYDLSHLTQLTFLQLADWPWEYLSSRELPPCLQQLEVIDMDNDNLAVLEEQREVVTAWDIEDLEERRAQRLLTNLPNLTGARVTARDLSVRGALTAVQQLCKLSTLTLSNATDFVSKLNVQSVVAAAASMSSLQCLYLQSFELTDPPALTVLTQLTQLRVSAWRPVHCTEEQQAAWAEMLQRMAGLRWLSVPGVLLRAGQGWLHSMQQLQVSMLHVTVSITSTTSSSSSSSSMPWLEGCTREVLPPQLQLLGMSGMSAQQAAAWQLRRRLQQLLGSSGCEVVVGVDLDEVCDSAQQLAGIPVALQQVLA